MSVAFSHSPAEVIQHLLVDLGLVSLGASPTALTWPCFSYNEVTAPDDAVFVIGTTGVAQARIQWDGEQIQKYGISIMLRARDPLSGERKIRQIETALMEDVLDMEVEAEDDDGTPHVYLIHSLGFVSGIIPLGKEQNTPRNLWSSNYLAVITPQS